MEDNKKVCPEGCECVCHGDKTCKGWWCGGGYGHGRHHFLRVILGIVILVLVFWCGFRLGALVGVYGGWYSGHMFPGMMWRGGSYYIPQGMMGGWYYPTSTPYGK